MTKTIARFLGVLVFVIFAASPGLCAEAKPVRVTPQEMELLKTLKQREETVAAREAEQESREKDLVALKEEVDGKIAKLETLQKEVQERLDRYAAVQDKEFKNLIKIYSGMSPSKLAPLLNKMEIAEAVQILRAMKADLVAKVVPKLDADKAVSVSRQLGLLDEGSAPGR